MEGFPVYGHNIIVCYFADGVDPTENTRLPGIGIQRDNYPPNRIGGGDAVGKRQEPGEPF